MTRALLLHLDGRLPNLALMRLSTWLRSRGVEVHFRRADNPRRLERSFDEPAWDEVYASLIFERTRPAAQRVRELYPHAQLGGTGWDLAPTLEQLGVPADTRPDYTLYPRYRQSLGFTQRGCRLKCSFCVVPRKEGAVRETASAWEIWRGDPWPRELVLLDNDFFGQPHWRERIDEIRHGNFKVSFTQGINARLLDAETAAAVGSVRYFNDDMTRKRIYTAWDNRKDEARLFAGLEALVAAGVTPREIMVYMLIGYWPNETAADREYRRARLRAFGALPYPMPYVRTRELVGFQRWVIGGYDRRGIPWAEWVGARYQPVNLSPVTQLELMEDTA